MSASLSISVRTPDKSNISLEITGKDRDEVIGILRDTRSEVEEIRQAIIDVIKEIKEE